MAEHGLNPLCPLGEVAPKVVTIGTVTITERTDVALASLAPRRGREDEVRATATGIGLPLPDPAKAQPGAPWGAVWLTPEIWLVEAPFDSHEDIVGHLKPVFGDSASITEQTDAWVRLDVTGDDLPRLFERLCNVDLATRPDGHATRTVIEHLGVTLICRAAGEVTLYGPRSSAGSLMHALEVAAVSAFRA